MIVPADNSLDLFYVPSDVFGIEVTGPLDRIDFISNQRFILPEVNLDNKLLSASDIVQ